MELLQSRLLPGFLEKYWEKIIFILDNALYHHHGTVADWKSPLMATKIVNARLLHDLVWGQSPFDAVADATTSPTRMRTHDSPELRGGPLSGMLERKRLAW